MSLAAGRLKRRITIQRPRTAQDPDDGLNTTNWITVAADVPAEIAPLSVREFVSANAMQSQISARIVIRYRDGLTADMRILHPASGKVYNPAGWLADPDTGGEYLTAPCSEGVNDGT